ncbi:MAG: YicC family protein [Bacteroidales bacterium]|nr:YicC family protein [Bacteroidales bacterium]
MLKSMTGFGQETGSIKGKKIIIEVRTLNSKTLDANLRLSAKFRDLEPEIRTMLGSKIDRGKVDLYMTLENETDFSDYKVNRDLAKHYLNELQLLGSEVGLPITADLLSTVLRLPDVVTQSASEMSEEDKQLIMRMFETALEKVDAFRIFEGAVLEKDFRQRINAILELLKETKPFEGKRIEDIRQRLRSDLAQIEQRIQIDNNRFEQEIIYYLEKIDFTEEKLRLEKHCNDFLRTISDDVSQGRKLGFIAQEIGREINTLGSKAYNADIQKIVVEMKNELEKVKEQLLNIL